MNKPKEPYSFSLNDGKSDPVTVPHDIAQYLIQRQQNMDDDNREIERLQKSEKKLRELMEVIDAHGHLPHISAPQTVIAAIRGFLEN